MPPLPLVLAIGLPLLGAGGTLVLSPLARVRSYTRYIALVAVGLTTILTVALRRVGPVAFIPSLWQPSLLFRATLVLHSDAAVQPLVVVLASVTCSAVLVQLGRMEEPHPRLLGVAQALLASGFVALWAANPLTMALAWVIHDLLQAAGHIAAGGSARTAVRSLAFGGVATLLLWSGALLSGGEAGGEMWSMMTLTGVQSTLWVLAGVLRLWLYPFHLAAPDDLGAASSLAAPLSLSPILGWGLWLRLALANSGSIPEGKWVSILAAITLAMGGFLAWSCKSLHRAPSWAGKAAIGAVLLAAGLAGDSAAAVITTGSGAWALGLGAILLSDGLRREAPWWSISPLVGALALLGVPLTLGFVTSAILLGGLTRVGRLEWGSAFVFGNVFLVPALARWLMASPSFSAPRHRLLAVVYGAGLGLPMLLLIMGGGYPSLLAGSAPIPALGTLFAMPGLTGWLLWIVSLTGGGVLAWQERNLRPKIELWLSAFHDLLGLEWLYDAIVGAFGRGLNVLRAADEVVGGGGALLWSWLLFLLLVLIWGSG